MGIRSTSWRPSSIPNATAGPATGRRTGCCWGERRGVGRTAPTSGRTVRSRKCWGIHSRRAFVSCWRRDRMKAAKESVEVNLPELEALLERKREVLGEKDYQKLKK